MKIPFVDHELFQARREIDTASLNAMCNTSHEDRLKKTDCSCWCRRSGKPHVALKLQQDGGTRVISLNDLIIWRQCRLLLDRGAKKFFLLGTEPLSAVPKGPILFGRCSAKTPTILSLTRPGKCHNIT